MRPSSICDGTRMTPAQTRQLGHIMCDLTRDLLWHERDETTRSLKAGSTLTCRVGGGQATYHRFDAHRNRHLITYGVRMIAAKQQLETAQGWLSTREILKRGYFGAEVSPLNLLAHTCCHEFAHLLQQSAGKRFRGSVHNRHFYQSLDQLHANGSAEAVRTALLARAQDHDLALSTDPFDLASAQRSAPEWQVGEVVAFHAGKREVQGRIRRVNRKTCTVEGTGRAVGVRYRVPLPLLRKAG